MSRAKSIQLVDGAVTTWDMLSSQDIKAGNFEFEDLIEAMKIAVRLPMYNRIDYSDIYSEAVTIYRGRRHSKMVSGGMLERRKKEPSQVDVLDEVNQIRRNNNMPEIEGS